MGTDLHRANVREFIRAMSVELSQLAERNGLNSLAMVLDMAREVADTTVARSDEHLERQA
jgi:hypothetical protein